MMEKFKEWYQKRHEYAQEWKNKTGGKVVGYFCTCLFYYKGIQEI